MHKQLDELLKAAREKKYSPVFPSFSLVLTDPGYHGAENYKSVKDVLSKWSEHIKAIPVDSYEAKHELTEICLYNLDLKNLSKVEEFLDDLIKYYTDNEILVMVKLPELDQIFTADIPMSAIKAKYRHLQNLALKHQRKLRAKAVLTATAKLDETVVSTWRGDVPSHHSKQPWPAEGEKGFNKKYELVIGTSLEQQQQHERQQQRQHQQQKQQQLKSKIETEVYGGRSESDLITVENVARRYPGIKDLIKCKLPENSGDTPLAAHVFSLFVGGAKPVDFCIEKMEPAAFERLVKDARKFLLGLSVDDLPAGFVLKKSREAGKSARYILCYNPDVERKVELGLHVDSDPVRKAFRTLLTPPMGTVVFKGNQTQFAELDEDLPLPAVSVLWSSLAIEDSSLYPAATAASDRSTGSITDRRDLGEKDRLVCLQADEISCVTVRTRSDLGFKDKLTFAGGVGLLKQWAQKNLPDADFTDPANKVKFIDVFCGQLDQKSLLALGQLFYHSGLPATLKLFKLAHKIYTAFGEGCFKIWVKVFVKNSSNLTELLQKDEIDAVVESLAWRETVIEDTVTAGYVEIWWKLAEVHGAVVGHEQYSALWQAFQMLLQELEHGEGDKLSLNQEAFLKYLASAETSLQFNATVFLDRLYSVLQATKKQSQRQYVLDNLEKIDWSHSGIYYAVVTEGFKSWFPELRLSQWQATHVSKGYSAVVQVDGEGASLSYADWKLQALRYIAQRYSLEESEFKNILAYFDAIESQSSSDQLKKSYGYALLIGLVYGTDSIDKLVDPRCRAELVGRFVPTMTTLATLDSSTDLSDNGLIELIRQFPIDESRRTANKILLPFPIVVQLATILGKDWKAVSGVLGLEPIKFLNAFERYIIYYCKTNECSLQDAIDAGVVTSFYAYIKANQDHGLILIACPWLYHEGITAEQLPVTLGKHQAEFVRLLESIDLERSDITRLPSKDELDSVIAELNLADFAFQAANICQEFVLRKTADGCVFQQASTTRYRALNETEISNIMRGLDLLEAHKAHNEKLYRDFLKKVAIPSGLTGSTESLARLLKALSAIDNKKHINELGLVLAVLTANATGTENYYSFDQLAIWLEELRDVEDPLNNPYPVSQLQEVLKYESKNDTKTLCGSLDTLQSEPSSWHKELLRKLRELKLPSIDKQALLRIGLLSEECFQSGCDILSRLPLPEKYFTTNWRDAVRALITYYAAKDVLDSGCTASIMQEVSAVSGFRSDSPLYQFWEDTQSSLAEYYSSPESTQVFPGALSLDSRGDQNKLVLIRLIVCNSIEIKELIGNDENKELLRQAVTGLSNWDIAQLQQLALYYKELPRPSLKYLAESLRSHSYSSYSYYSSVTAAEWIYKFETVGQGTGKDGRSLRLYSVTPEDHTNLLRVVTELKLKTGGLLTPEQQSQLITLLYYANSFAEISDLDKTPTAALTELCTKLAADVRSNKTDIYAKARLLAVMREIGLRKTQPGKWTNHTQMLVLLYAAVHGGDVGAVYQVVTGEGKSIITLLRAAYFALLGDTVDVFSSKADLSKRDAEEAKSPLAAMGIQSAHITVDSSLKDYVRKSSASIGGVNYSTSGNLGLWEAKKAWEGKSVEGESIDLSSENRVAVIDEVDYALDVRVQFNHTTKQDDEDIYNHDAWIYRLAYKYYLEIQPGLAEKPYFTVQNLEALCNILLKAAPTHKPAMSRFMEKYIYPAGATSAGEHEITVRDQSLLKLLMAVHGAYHLGKDKEYCVSSYQQDISDGLKIDMCRGVVMTDNQAQPGSTYSDGVHTMLHVKLDEKAVGKGKMPNHFIPPDAEIVLSLCTEQLFDLSGSYRLHEGFTGSTGGSRELAEYRELHGMADVVCIPTHVPSRTVTLEDKFVTSEDDQIKEILQAIREAGVRPMLIACEDDAAVKRLEKALKKALGDPSDESSESSDDGSSVDSSTSISKRIYRDINADGLSEGEVIRQEGSKEGRIIISSRMGRGTDWRPKDREQGLYVLRTYVAANERIATQEFGRQGRNGDAGVIKQIINIGDIKERMKKSGVTLDGLSGEAICTAYQDWKYRAAKILNQDRENKDYLIASLSFAMMRYLAEQTGETLSAGHTAWKNYREKIEDAWRRYLVEKKDGFVKYRDFLKTVEAITKENEIVLDAVNSQYRSVDGLMKRLHDRLSIKERLISVDSTDASVAAARPALAARTADSTLDSLLYFYQRWIAGIKKYHKGISPEIKKIFYGDKGEFVQRLFVVLDNFNTTGSREVKTHFFGILKTLMDSEKLQGLYVIPADVLTEIFTAIYGSLQPGVHYTLSATLLNYYFSLPVWEEILAKDQESGEKNFKKYGNLAKIITRLIMSLSKSKLTVAAEDYQGLINRVMTILINDYSENLEQQEFVELMGELFDSPNINGLLAIHTNGADMSRIINDHVTGQPSATQTFTTLQVYIDKHGTDLSTLDAVFMPVRDLVQTHAVQADVLPEPKFFRATADSVYGLVWQLVERAHKPLVNKDIVALGEVFTDVKLCDAFSSLREQLLALPRNVLPLSVLVNVLRHGYRLGKETHADCISLVQKLNLAASSLTAYTSARSITFTVGVLELYYSPVNLDSTKSLFDLLNQVNYKDLPIEQLNKLIALYCNLTVSSFVVDIPGLTSALEVASAAQKLDARCAIDAPGLVERFTKALAATTTPDAKSALIDGYRDYCEVLSAASKSLWVDPNFAVEFLDGFLKDTSGTRKANLIKHLEELSLAQRELPALQRSFGNDARLNVLLPTEQPISQELLVALKSLPADLPVSKICLALESSPASAVTRALDGLCIPKLAQLKKIGELKDRFVARAAGATAVVKAAMDQWSVADLDNLFTTFDRAEYQGLLGNDFAQLIVVGSPLTPDDLAVALGIVLDMHKCNYITAAIPGEAAKLGIEPLSDTSFRKLSDAESSPDAGSTVFSVGIADITAANITAFAAALANPITRAVTLQNYGQFYTALVEHQNKHGLTLTPAVFAKAPDLTIIPLLHELKTAQQALSVTPNQQVWDSNFDADQQTRLAIMRCVARGLLPDVSTPPQSAYSARYFGLLGRRIAAIFRGLRKLPSTLSIRRGFFRFAFNRLGDIIAEINKIITPTTPTTPTTPPAATPVANSATPPVFSKQAEDIFKNKKKEYASYWWVSRSREKIASDMFQQLERIRTANPTKASTEPSKFLVEAFGELRRARELIVKQDGSWQNRKGYSRLHDIIKSIELELIQAYLQHPAVSIADKAAVRDQLALNAQGCIKLLKKKLTAKHKVTAALTQSGTTVTGLVKYSSQTTALKTAIQSKSIPTSLQHLADAAVDYGNAYVAACAVDSAPIVPTGPRPVSA